MWYYILVLILVIYFLTKNRSSFTNIYDTYSQPSVCGQAQGHLPGSNIIFTNSERNNLMFTEAQELELLKKYVGNS